MAASGALSLLPLLFLLILNSVSAIPPEELHAVLRVLRSRGYGRIEDAIAMSDLSFDFLSAGTLTLFAPPDSSLFSYHTARPVPPASYLSVLRYHAVPHRLSISDLRSLPTSSVTLPTLLFNRFLNVTVRKADPVVAVKINGVQLDSPGLYYGIHVAVHGLAGSLTLKPDKANAEGSLATAPDSDSSGDAAADLSTSSPQASPPLQFQATLPPASPPAKVKPTLPPEAPTIKDRVHLIPETLPPATPPVLVQATVPPAAPPAKIWDILPPATPPATVQRTLPPAAPPVQVEAIFSPAATSSANATQDSLSPNQEQTNQPPYGDLPPQAATQLPDFWGDVPPQAATQLPDFWGVPPSQPAIQLLDVWAPPILDLPYPAAPPLPEIRDGVWRRRRRQLSSNSIARHLEGVENRAASAHQSETILSLRRQQEPTAAQPDHLRFMTERYTATDLNGAWSDPFADLDEFP